MSSSLIAVSTLIYVWVAIDLYIHGKYGLSVAYAGYAFANIGLLMAART